MSDKAFLIIASRWDAAAVDFATRYAEHGVRLMTPDDLSQSGWSYRVGDGRRSTAIIGGSPIAARGIATILTRIPCVTVDDLPHIADQDRAYVAAEMTAFLLAWLDEMDCPCINRPTAGCLSGPAWSHEKWIMTAARIGIPIEVSRQTIRLSQAHLLNASLDAPSAAKDTASVTAVGRQCVGAVDPSLKRAARALADAARTDLLVVRFSSADAGASFVNADYSAALDDAEIGAAVWRHLDEVSGGNERWGDVDRSDGATR